MDPESAAPNQARLIFSVAAEPGGYDRIDKVACAWQRPLLSAEVTRGMKKQT